MLFCITFSVVSCYDDSDLRDTVSALEERVKSLETLCSEMNVNINSLQGLVAATQGGKYISEVSPLTENGLVVGYKITLSDGSSLSVYHGKNGKDGEDGAAGGNAPQIGVRQDDDGNYYWVVDGEWILDDEGRKLPVTSEAGKDGVTPEIKVEGGKWYVSYDDGDTWKVLGDAVADDSCLFDDVTFVDGVLKFVFADGEVLSFTVGNAFRIVFGEFDPNWGTRIEIPYTIQGTAGEVSLFVISNFLYGGEEEYFGAEIIEETEYSGKIVVELDCYEYVEYSGQLGIFAVNESGTTVSGIVNLATGVFRATHGEQMDYRIGSDAAEFEIDVTTNRTLKVNTNADWITFVETKAVENRHLVFAVEANEGLARKTEVEVVSGDMKLVFPVFQNGDGEDFTVNLEYNEVTGGITTVYLSRDMYMNGTLVEAPVNKYGQTVHEFLGYESWDELAAAIGDEQTVTAFAGDVVITAFDVRTGESFGEMDYFSSNSPSYLFDKDGQIVGYEGCVSWTWPRLMDDPRCLDYFYFNFTGSVVAGESYSFGIMLSSENKTAYIEVNIRITEYIDPESGRYDNPEAPGKYEIDLEDELVVDVPLIESTNNYYFESEIASEPFEKVKEILGMTTYEMSKAGVEHYFLNGDEKDYNMSMSFDSEGNMSQNFDDWLNDATLMVIWSLSNRPEGCNLAYYFPNNNGLGTAAREAVESGLVIKYQYVFECNDYEIIFNHKITLKKAE